MLHSPPSCWSMRCSTCAAQCFGKPKFSGPFWSVWQTLHCFAFGCTSIWKLLHFCSPVRDQNKKKYWMCWCSVDFMGASCLQLRKYTNLLSLMLLLFVFSTETSLFLLKEQPLKNLTVWWAMQFGTYVSPCTLQYKPASDISFSLVSWTTSAVSFSLTNQDYYGPALAAWSANFKVAGPILGQRRYQCWRSKHNSHMPTLQGMFIYLFV